MITISDAILRALGWALAHSLWQGAVAALLLLILLPRLQTARQRYWAAYGTLASIFLAALGTFFWSFEPESKLGTLWSDTGLAPGMLAEQAYFETNISETFAQWLESNHTLIVAVWLIGFVFFLFRLGGGLWQIQRLRTRGLNAPDALWLEKTQVLASKIGVSRSVKLLESAWVNTPLTIGWLKPAILLPIGLLNQLSQAEVEAVLAHELAHIARRDWVFNLLQAFIETIFYYHPAVWWVSQIIRRERENACDDVALAATGNPIAFARALVQVQELATLAPTLALAMSGGKRRRPLLERVRRILNQAPQQQHQVMEKITATVILFVLLALIGLRANSVPSLEAAFAQIADLPVSFLDGQDPEDQIVSDSLPKPKGTRKITREDENGRVEAEYKDGKIQRLKIDGAEIPAAEFGAHEALIEELEADVPPPPPPPAFPRMFWDSPAAPEAPDAPGQAGSPSFPPFPPFPALPPMPPIPNLGGGLSIVTDQDEEGNTIIKLDNQGAFTDVVIKNGSVWLNGKKLEKGEPIRIPGLSFEEGDFPAGEGFAYGFSAEDQTRMNEELTRMYEEMARMNEAHARMAEKQARAYELDQKRQGKEWKKSQKEWEKEQKQWQKEQKTWEKEQRQWEREQQTWQAEQQGWQARNQATQDALKTELLKDGLISNPDDFSLKLTAKSLEVNKKKQSEAMHQKYLEMVESTTGNKIKGDNSFYYNYSEN